MRSHIGASLIVLTLLLPLPGGGQEPGRLPAQPRTLKEVFAAALANSEAIAISAQAVREAEGLYLGTLGSSFPELSFRHETLRQDRPVSAASTRGARATQSEGGLRLSKAELTGYRELAALKAGGAAISQRKHEKLRAEQLLLADVAGAFFGQLQARENGEALRRLIALAERRLGELGERVRVGRSRETDAIGQEFQVASLRAQLEESARQAAARRDLLGYLANSPGIEPAAGDGPEPGGERGLGDYLSRLESRPDILAAKEERAVADGLLRVRRSEYLPHLGLTANLYAYRPENRSASDWDVSVGVGVPLLSWGARGGAVEAAAAALRRRELGLDALRRRAELEVRNAHRDYGSAKTQLELLRSAVELARRDYALQSRDEKRGLVTSLELLESLDRLNGAELAFNNARLQARLAALGLDIASGAPFEEMALLR